MGCSSGSVSAHALKACRTEASRRRSSSSGRSVSSSARARSGPSAGSAGSALIRFRIAGAIASSARSRTTAWLGIVYRIELTATPASSARAFTVNASTPSRAITRQAAAITLVSRALMLSVSMATANCGIATGSAPEVPSGAEPGWEATQAVVPLLTMVSTRWVAWRGSL